MVRDQKSFDFAQAQFDCPVLLVPDSAFCIDMRTYPRVTGPVGIGCLLRADRERRPDADAGQRLFSDAVTEDWHQRGEPRRLFEKAVMGGLMALSARPALSIRERSFTSMAAARVALGFAQLDRAKVIVTDRLHGHIMATLLGKPHVVIDNFYGKIINFINAWGADDMTLCAQDYVAARQMALTLLNADR
jgi:exopolysaccharide biosynthesis predicted pyruvyltransferase EpsI